MPLIHSVLNYFLEVKRPEHDADHSPLSSADVELYLCSLCVCMVRTGRVLPVLTRAVENMKIWHTDIHAGFNYLMPCFVGLIITQLGRYVVRLSIIVIKCSDQVRSMIGEMIQPSNLDLEGPDS